MDDAKKFEIADELIRNLSSLNSLDDFNIETALGKSWQRLWAERISPLLRETNPGTTETPGVDFDELARYRFDDFTVHLYSAVRVARRFFQRLTLESFVEERNFGDYRSGLEQVLVDLQREVDELSDYAEEAMKAVANVEARVSQLKRLPASASASTPTSPPARQGPPPEWSRAERNLQTLFAALFDASMRLSAAASWTRDQSFRTELFEKVRDAYLRVQDSWGTWQRRIREPLKVALRAFAVSLVCYLLLGSVLPSTLLATILLIVPLAAAYQRYYAGRDIMKNEIRPLLHALKALNPDDETGAPHNSVWTPAVVQPPSEQSQQQLEQRTVTPRVTPAEMMASLLKNLSVSEVARVDNLPTSTAEKGPPASGTGPRSKLRERLSTAAHSSWSLGISKVALWTALGTVLLVGALYVRYGGWPRFQVHGTCAEGPCVLAAGYVYWAGPVHMIVRDRRDMHHQHMTLIPTSRVVRIQRFIKHDEISACISCQTAPPTAASASAPRLNVQTFVTNLEEQAQRPDVLVVPFAEARVSCAVKGNEDGVKLDTHAARTVEAFRTALAACAQTRKPLLDIRGYASGAEFSCTDASRSNELNLKLAEERRNNVLRALHADVSAQGTWSGTSFDLQPTTGRRWTSFQHMMDTLRVTDSDNGAYDPRKGAATRRVEIRVLDYGGCDRLIGQIK